MFHKPIVGRWYGLAFKWWRILKRNTSLQFTIDVGFVTASNVPQSLYLLFYYTQLHYKFKELKTFKVYVGRMAEEIFSNEKSKF